MSIGRNEGKSRWLPFTTWRKAEIRLFCLPYAGGSAYLFKSWQDLLPSRIEVSPIEIPGHGTRFQEAPLVRVDLAVQSLADELHSDQTPISIFGHSMGALLAFELARELKSRGRRLNTLFISGHPAPHLPWTRPNIRNHEPKDFAQALV